jgi:hypothetical protein
MKASWIPPTQEG